MQRENKGKRVILYPHYFDSRLSRSKGRRIPKKLAVRDPKANEILDAARSLGLEAYVEDARYPRAWWRLPGRIVVEKKGESKQSLINKIAEELFRKRQRQK